MADSANEQVAATGGGLTPASAYSAGQHGTGYQTPDLATRSSSPGSGSFHTANPIDSERSSLTGNSDGGEWDRERQDELSSVEIPSFGDIPTLLVSDQGQGRANMGTMYTIRQMAEEEEEETDATLRNDPSSSPAVSDGQRGKEASGVSRERRNYIDQPKLEPAESETVPPCPQKRPLREETEYRQPPHSSPVGEPSRETTPLLQSSNRQSSCSECCTIL